MVLLPPLKHLHPTLHFLYRCRNCRNSTDHHSSNYHRWDGSLVNVQWSYKLKNYSMSIPFKRIMLIFMTFFHNLDTNANFEWKSLSWKIYEYFLCAESLMNDNLEKDRSHSPSSSHLSISGLAGWVTDSLTSQPYLETNQLVTEEPVKTIIFIANIQLKISKISLVSVYDMSGVAWFSRQFLCWLGWWCI